MIVPAVLPRVIRILDQVGIAYMLTGSFASAYHGALRSTQDIDLVIEANPDRLLAIVQNLPTDQFYVEADTALEALKRESMFNLIDLTAGWKIGLIIRKSRSFSRQEFRRRQLVNLQGTRIFIASAEDIVIAKLEWSKMAQSRRQIEDVSAILRVRWQALDRGYVKRWVADLGLDNEWTEALRVAGIADSE
jgi:hypothetical protein